MRVAILGASSRIAADFLVGLGPKPELDVCLFARDAKRVEVLTGFPSNRIYSYSAFNVTERFDAIVNFVGQSSPETRSAPGNAIRAINQKFDELALAYLGENAATKYVYLSSGAALGSHFLEPANSSTPYSRDNLDDYAMAKQESELRHKTAQDLDILDLRIFSYFHRTQSQESNFLMSEIISAIRREEVLEVDSNNIWRDFLGAADFSQLLFAALSTNLRNVAIDAFSMAPISKFEILEACAAEFKFRYVIKPEESNSGQGKQRYYSLARSAGFPYQPTKNSMENILTEMAAMLRCE